MDETVLADASLERRAQAARYLIRHGEDGILLLSYVIWPKGDYQFAKFAKIEDSPTLKVKREKVRDVPEALCYARV